MTPEDQTAALSEFPILRRLIGLRDAGWIFLTAFDPDGQMIEVHGVRTWPDGWADALRVRYTTDARGLRNDSTGAITWQLDGNLDDVVNGLITLPPPGNRLAPYLVIATNPMSRIT
jgi:hypothetical protein